MNPPQTPNLEPQQAPPEVPSDLSPDPNLDAALNNMFGMTPQGSESPKQEKSEVKAEDPIQREISKREKYEDQNKPVEQKETTNLELPDPDTFKAPEKLKNKEGWNVLKENYAKANRFLKEKEEEIQKLKESLGNASGEAQKKIEVLEKKLEQLSEFQVLGELETDPEFINKYDKPIDKITSDLKGMLTSMGVSEDTIKKIDFTNSQLVDTILNLVEEHRGKLDARRMMRKAEELIELSDKREEEMNGWRSKKDQYVQEKRKKTAAQQTQYQAEIEKFKNDAFEAKSKDGNPEFPFLFKITPKQGASTAEIQQVEKNNQVVDMMRSELDQILKLESPKDKLGVAIAALGAKWLSFQLKSVLEANQKLQKEIERISKSSSENRETKIDRKPIKNGSLDVDDALAAHGISGAR